MAVARNYLTLTPRDDDSLAGGIRNPHMGGVPLIKFTILLRRKQALTREAFVEHHKTVHAALFMSVEAVKANVRRYVQQHTLDIELPGMPPAKYDGMTELWFDDVAGIAAVFQDSEYMARIRPDEETFLDLPGCDFLVTTENPVAP